VCASTFDEIRLRSSPHKFDKPVSLNFTLLNSEGSRMIGSGVFVRAVYYLAKVRVCLDIFKAFIG